MSTKILIIAGVSIVVLIVLIRTYHFIHMGLARLIFGKHSSRYIQICKNYTGQSPYPYCIKDDFINHIAGFYKNSEKLSVFESEKEITFLNKEFGSRFKTIFNAEPKPFCINSNRLQHFDLKVLGYKDLMYTSEMKKYYYFANGIFFLGQLSFKNPTQDNIREINRVIQKKYLNENAPETGNYLINGVNNTSLLCEYNGFHLIISYKTNGIPQVNKLIKEYWESSTNRQLGPRSSLEAELMEKL